MPAFLGQMGHRRLPRNSIYQSYTPTIRFEQSDTYRDLIERILQAHIHQHNFPKGQYLTRRDLIEQRYQVQDLSKVCQTRTSKRHGPADAETMLPLSFSTDLGTIHFRNC